MLEELLVPTWERVKSVLAGKRGRAAPADDEVLAALRRDDQAWHVQDLGVALAERPKAVLAALLRILQLRHNAPLFGELGRQLSVPKLKQRRCLDRIMATLQRWFPPTEAAGAG
jgi:hypothetical protein